LVCLIASCWLVDKPSFYQLQINLLLGLIIDIILVMFIKAAIRRRSPLGTDKFSFPSGHVSRATLVMSFLIVLCPIHFTFWLALVAWTTSICVTSVLTQRSYVLDVIAGIGWGMFEALVMSIVWLNQEQCEHFLTWLGGGK
jgi:presqualene diphosphate phosphatase